MVTRNNVLCRRRRFCFRHPVRGELLFSPHVFLPKMLRFFRGIQKRTERPLAFVGAPVHGDNTSSTIVLLTFFPSFFFTPKLRCGPSSWGYGLPRFCVAPQVGDTDSHTFPWPVELGIRTPTLLRGPVELGIRTTSPLASQGPKRGRNCYVIPAFSGVPNAKRGEKIRGTSSLPSWGPKRGRNCYVTPAFSGVPNAKRGEKIRSGYLTPSFPSDIR